MSVSVDFRHKSDKTNHFAQVMKLLFCYREPLVPLRDDVFGEVEEFKPPGSSSHVKPTQPRSSGSAGPMGWENVIARCQIR
jgi:hypothetical protein